MRFSVAPGAHGPSAARHAPTVAPSATARACGYIAHASHATYPRPGMKNRPWPDPNDELRADGRRVRPHVTVITDDQPAWVRSRAPWGPSRAAWWNPAEASSPLGPRFQDDGRWAAPAAWHSGARSCTSGPPGYPWWVFAGLAVPVALLLARTLGKRASPAC
jgi:hypothetical protein